MKRSLQPSPKSKKLIGDEALDDLVNEEYRNNTTEERERMTKALTGSSWLG